MKNVCVVTGGGSGMGLATAEIMGKDHYIVLVGRTPGKLENALAKLHSMGVEAESFPCDVSSRESVQTLAEHVQSLGQVKAVIHAAGMSPHMGGGDIIFNVNAMGTIYMNEELAKIMPAGSCILNVSSMSAYMVPADKVPSEVYKLSLSDSSVFQEKMLGIVSSVPGEMSSNMAYTLSKNFVVWYSEKAACIHGKNGIRILSVSPGTFKTPMGELEGEQAASFALASALGRLGEPEEIGELMAFLASEKCSYLTGVDILCDGGTIAAMRSRS
ncbi:NAD(P)-dependent dehydrogenase (short-subunit alcohol dehydrogenase family) [Kineothrix alysoides]|uniref:NAD(P)-dependent dehydrogenase (Short-subunit alcohol dehydrogenase family) n=1 Tax=Kineothrix alysoides TaxID=1469948 RepID=A0A4R1QY90_9FIRM|nr:SDR family oxidoreductase [Kineothrix alysoides]TCL56980.1 NAD(P)-dependent dehydrogenase (short-subunit alcohol dehydrogenase family) [Kineothrix alysoides]